MYLHKKDQIKLTGILYVALSSLSCGFPLVSFTGSIQRSTSLQSTSIITTDIPSLKSLIRKAIAPTNRGITATPSQKSEIEDLLQNLETCCPLKEPARDPRMEGKWRVQYSTAPAPSNGQLGPFLGVARQIIDLENGSYINKLEVEPNEWLSAELKARWFEWDGKVLEADDIGDTSEDITNEQNPEENIFSLLQSSLSKIIPNPLNNNLSGKGTFTDYGATSWKVDFQSLSIRLFGISIVSKEFENTSRVWRMSYLDDEVRIVRAGRTGKGEDDFVFYMTRED